ncbi:MBL fold metallo-hydrolase [Chloroflexota bacterium]
MSVEAILLGTAQDGGIPQAGCDCATCRAAWENPLLRRRVACLGLVDRAAGQSWLIDCTPDFREQHHTLCEMAPGCRLDGILLTHAHAGHYAGLIHLGREAWNTSRMPLYASQRMARFLQENGPWSQLVAQNNVELRLLSPAIELRLSGDLRVTPWRVPHRDEFSDTLAYVVRGPRRRLFYCPDIDAWDLWDQDVRGFVGEMDVALLDGTFFGEGELQGRDPREVPHPMATDTAERLAGVGCEVRLLHLNHSNPLVNQGPEREWLAQRGIGLGELGIRWRLD